MPEILMNLRKSQETKRAGTSGPSSRTRSRKQEKVAAAGPAVQVADQPASRPEDTQGVPPLPDLMTVKEICRWTLKTDRTIRNWIEKGYLRPIRIGRSIFFQRDEVAALLSPPD
jgi:excisionase family DNA binding protein